MKVYLTSLKTRKTERAIMQKWSYRVQTGFIKLSLCEKQTNES